MKKMILTCSILSMPLSVMANDFHANVNNFNMSYTFPSGFANSQQLIYSDYQYLDYTDYSVEHQAGVLMLQTPDESIQVHDLPDFINYVESLSVQNLNLTSTNTQVTADVSRFTTQATSSFIDIKRFAIDCNYQDINQDFTDEVLHSCFNNKGNISMSSFILNGSEIVSDTYFTLSQNNMSFQLRAQGLKIKGYGKTYYDNDQIRIRVDRARFGFINVQGRLFNELKMLESENIRINNPWIEIDL